MSEKSPKKRTENRLFYTSAALIFSSLFLMGQFASTVKKADDDQFWEFTAMFAEIYKEVKDRYVEPVDSKKLFEGALQGMFLTLDPHSQYMDPDSYTQLEKDTEGSFSGIGIHIGLDKNGILQVISPIPGSPSAKAGLKPADRIIEINGKKTENITLTDAVKKLTGPTGTTVDITVFREGETEFLHFTLPRQSVKIESVYSQMMPDFPEIGYARVTKFSDNTARDLRKAIDSFKENNAKGIVLDLRFNTGGLLKEAVEVSNLFLPKGKLVVSTKGRTASQTTELKAEKDQATDLPLVVLINRGSASASEIVAGAIKDHERGLIVGQKGQRSFGKGSVQTIEDLEHSFEKDENGNYRPSAIRLTTAKYYTPSGVSIDKIGVTPDIAIEMPKDNEKELSEGGHLLGDPSRLNDDDSETTKTKFDWSNLKSTDDTTTVSSETKTEDKVTTEPEDKKEDSEEIGLAGSAVKNDDSTTNPQPKRIIPLDKTLFPDAEIEGAVKKPQEEEKKKKDPASYIDYQLHSGAKILKQWIESGVKPIEPEETDIKDTKSIAASGRSFFD